VEAAKEQTALKKRQLTADVSKAEADARKAEFESNPEVIEANREVEIAKNEASLAKSASEIRIAELKVQEAERKAEEARNKAAGGGAGGMTEAQYYTAQSRAINMLGPQNRADQFQRLLDQASTQQRKKNEATSFMNSAEGQSNKGSQMYKDMQAQATSMTDALRRTDQAIADLAREQSRSIEDRIGDTPGLRALLIDLNNMARGLRKQIPFPGRSALPPLRQQYRACSKRGAPSGTETLMCFQAAKE
jgi:hypothetical protein